MKHKLKLSFWASKRHIARSGKASSRQHGKRLVISATIASLLFTLATPLLLSESASAAGQSNILTHNMIKTTLSAKFLHSCFDTWSPRKAVNGRDIVDFKWGNGMRVDESGAFLNKNSGLTIDSSGSAAIYNQEATVVGAGQGTTVVTTSNLPNCSPEALKASFANLTSDNGGQILCKMGFMQSQKKDVDYGCLPKDIKWYYSGADRLNNGSGRTIDMDQMSVNIADFPSAAKGNVRLAYNGKLAINNYASGKTITSNEAMWYAYDLATQTSGKEAIQPTQSSSYTTPVTIWNYNAISNIYFSETWYAKSASAVPSKILSNGSSPSAAAKDFFSAVGAKTEKEAESAELRAQCEGQFGKNNESLDACMAGTKNKTAGYCDLTYLGINATSGKDSETKYEKIGKQHAQDLRDACLQGQTLVADIDVNPGANDVAKEVDICTILGDEIPMRWLACAMLSTMNSLTGVLYEAIQNILYTPINEVLGNEGYMATVDTFRNFAMALIFIVGLIMVIAQSTGSDIVDAYTVRKVLPRLAIAIIGIAIIVPVLKLGITLVNDLGLSMGRLITDIDPNTLAENARDKSNDAAVIGTQIALSVPTAMIAGAAAVGSFMLMGPTILTYLLAAILALLIAFVTLAMRQLIIVVLVLLAPMAVALSILPGTEKLWKFWRTTLITTLMAFPIMMLFLKSGTLMSSIFGSIGDDKTSGAYHIIAAIIFIAPYFMLPLAFKMAGGLMGNVFGMVNDRSKGLFDRMRNWRANSRKKNIQAMKDGTRFRDRGAASQAVNRGLQRATNLDKVDWLSPNRRQQMDAWQTAEAHKKAVKDMKENEFLSTFAQDDGMLQGAYQAHHGAAAVSQALAARDARRFALGPGATAEQVAANQQATALIMNARQTMGGAAFDRAIALANPYTGTGLNQTRDVMDNDGNVIGSETYTNYAQQFRVNNRAYADDAVGRQTATVMMKQGLSGSGHAVGNVSTGTFIGLSSAVNRGDMTEDEANALLHRQVAIELPPGAGAQGKIYAVRENAEAHGAYIQELLDAQESGDTVTTSYKPDGSAANVMHVDQQVIEYEMAKAYASLQAIGQSPSEGGDQYAALLQGRMLRIPGRAEQISVRDYMDELMRNKHFRERVMTYASAADANNAASIQPQEPSQPTPPSSGPPLP